MIGWAQDGHHPGNVQEFQSDCEEVGENVFLSVARYRVCNGHKIECNRMSTHVSLFTQEYSRHTYAVYVYWSEMSYHVLLLALHYITVHSNYLEWPK